LYHSREVRSDGYEEGAAIDLTVAEYGSDRRLVVDEIRSDLEGSNLPRSISVILVASVAVLLALLPAAIALRVLELPPGWVGAALGILGAAVSGVKLFAMAWALVARLSAPRLASVAVAPSD
jgi:hypothetical protein